MSTIAIVYSILTTVASLAWDYKRRKKIKQLRAGQEQWRQAAIAAGHRLEEMTGDMIDARLLALSKTARLNEVIASIWGEPPLNRSANDVIGYIKELQTIAIKQQKDKAKLADAYQMMSSQVRALEATLAARIQDLTLTEGALRDIKSEYIAQREREDAKDEDFTFLMENQLAVYKSGALECWIVMQACTTGTPIGSGPNPTDAINDAKTTLKRKDLGLKS